MMTVEKDVLPYPCSFYWKFPKALRQKHAKRDLSMPVYDDSNRLN